MRLPLVLLLISIFFTSPIFAQKNAKIKWGPREKHIGYYSLIGESGGHIFVHHLGRSSSLSSPNIKLFKYNQKNVLEQEYKLDDILGEDSKLVNMYASPDALHGLLFNDNDSKNIFLERIKLDPNNMKVIEREKIYSFKGNVEFVPVGYRGNSFANNVLYVLNTSTSNHLVLQYIIDNKIVKHQKKVLVFDPINLYKKINEFSFEYGEIGNKYQTLQDITISEKGHIHLLFKLYNARHRDEEKDKLPNYSLKVITKGDEEVTEAKISTDKQFLWSPRITLDETGNIYITALYQKKYNKQGRKTEGVFLVKLDTENNIQFKNSFASSFTKEDGRNPKALFEIIFSSTIKDKIIIAYQEIEQKSSFVGSSPSISYKHKNMFFESYDTDGNQIHSNILHDYSIQSDINVHIMKYFYTTESNLFFISNIHKKFVDALDIERKNSKSYPSKDNVIVLSEYEEGVFNHKKLSLPADITTEGSCIYFTNDTIYFIGYNRTNSKVTLGSVPRTD